MPSTDAPTATLGHALREQLIHDLLWMVFLAAAVVVIVVALSGRSAPTIERLRRAMFGSATREPEPPARRFIRISFGLLWIVDGLLQAQPAMPTSFVSQVIQPQASAGPSWLANLAGPLLRAWTRHPVTADAVSVWIQLGLGILLLIGGRGLLAKCTGWATIAWSLVVWIVGEAVGGLLAPGATWLAGAPGAVLVYLYAAVLLLLPYHVWTSGRAARLASRFVAAWFLLGALLQAIPAEQAWTARGAARSFADGAATAQPAVFRTPISTAATLASHWPAEVNAVTIALLVTVGAALWFSNRPGVVYAGLALCGITWWLAQDFGVLGGVGTDPNSGLPLALLLAVSFPAWSTRGIPAGSARTDAATAPAELIRTGFGAAVVALGVAAAVVFPAVLGSGLPGSADAAAVAADSGGGIRAIPNRSAPPFELVDQTGANVSLADLRGKLVVLTFLDAVCNTDCPLIAGQLGIADRRLGALAARVEFVAIDSNPVFHYRRDVAAFTDSHGLAELSNWHFLSGDPDIVRTVLADYGITVEVPTVGMIEHTDAIYFITPDGREAAYLEDGAAVQLTGTYAAQVVTEIRSLLK